jgi:hypothetical protein
MIEDVIIKHYQKNGCFKDKSDFSFLKDLGAYNSNPGLGDCILLTSLLKKVNCFSHSRFWRDICSLTKSGDQTPKEGYRYFFIEKVNELGSGNGHIINSIQRAFLGETQQRPKGYLGSGRDKVKGKVGICLTTGNSYRDLVRHGYKNPRQVYKETLNELNQFINSSPEYSFFEFGSNRVLNNGNVMDMTGLSIIESVMELSSCEYFIGLNSGFMNVAASFDIKSIIITNVPSVDKLYLPLLNTNTLAVHDLCWLYPQNVHLHQDGENELVPLANCYNLKKAINGEVYPFWKEDYLDLINYDFTISR